MMDLPEREGHSHEHIEIETHLDCGSQRGLVADGGQSASKRTNLSGPDYGRREGPFGGGDPRSQIDRNQLGNERVLYSYFESGRRLPLCRPASGPLSPYVFGHGIRDLSAEPRHLAGEPNS